MTDTPEPKQVPAIEGIPEIFVVTAEMKKLLTKRRWSDNDKEALGRCFIEMALRSVSDPEVSRKDKARLFISLTGLVGKLIGKRDDDMLDGDGKAKPGKGGGTAGENIGELKELLMLADSQWRELKGLKDNDRPAEPTGDRAEQGAVREPADVDPGHDTKPGTAESGGDSVPEHSNGTGSGSGSRG